MEPQARPAWPGLLVLTAPAVVHRVHQALKGRRVLQELTAPRELPVHLAQPVHKESQGPGVRQVLRGLTAPRGLLVHLAQRVLKEWQGPEVRPEPQELLAQLESLGRRARTAHQAPQD